MHSSKFNKEHTWKGLDIWNIYHSVDPRIIYLNYISMLSSTFQMNYQMMKGWVRLRRWWGKVIALTAEVDSPCITCSLASGGNLSFIPLLQSNLRCLLSIGHSASKLGLQTWCSDRERCFWWRSDISLFLFGCKTSYDINYFWLWIIMKRLV